MNFFSINIFCWIDPWFSLDLKPGIMVTPPTEKNNFSKMKKLKINKKKKLMMLFCKISAFFLRNSQIYI